MAEKGTVVEKQVEKKKKERFELASTHLTGVGLRVEPGTRLDILRRTIENFYERAKEYARKKWQIDDLTGQQAPRREEILDLVKKHEGLRGILSEEDNFVLTVVPRESISWNREILKESIGIMYAALAREELEIKISVPVGLTEKGILISEEVMEKVVKEALIGLGISEKELDSVVHQEVKVSLDEKKLTTLVGQGKLSLLPGAKTSEITWSLRVDQLKSKSGKRR